MSSFILLEVVCALWINLLGLVPVHLHPTPPVYPSHVHQHIIESHLTHQLPDDALKAPGEAKLTKQPLKRRISSLHSPPPTIPDKRLTGENDPHSNLTLYGPGLDYTSQAMMKKWEHPDQIWYREKLKRDAEGKTN